MVGGGRSGVRLGCAGCGDHVTRSLAILLAGVSITLMAVATVAFSLDFDGWDRRAA